MTDMFGLCLYVWVGIWESHWQLACLLNLDGWCSVYVNSWSRGRTTRDPIWFEGVGRAETNKQGMLRETMTVTCWVCWIKSQRQHMKFMGVIQKLLSMCDLHSQTIIILKQRGSNMTTRCFRSGAIWLAMGLWVDIMGNLKGSGELQTQRGREQRAGWKIWSLGDNTPIEELGKIPPMFIHCYTNCLQDDRLEFLSEKTPIAFLE